MKKFVYSMCVVSPIIVMVALLLAIAAFAAAVATKNPDLAAAALGFCGVALVAYGLTLDPEIVGVSRAALSTARGRGFEPAQATHGDADSTTADTNTESMDTMDDGDAEGQLALWRANTGRERSMVYDRAMP